MARCALVVDDEWLLVDYARTILEELGCEVITATCGSEALHALNLNPRIDLLITDVQMPEMNGLELIEQAKRQRPTLHVIVTSGHAEVPDGVPLVRKPFTRLDLVRTIERTTGTERDRKCTQARACCRVSSAGQEGGATLSFHDPVRPGS